MVISTRCGSQEALVVSSLGDFGGQMNFRLFLCVLAVFCLAACSKNSGDPELFLPHVLSPERADLDALRAQYCQASAVDLSGNLLTPDNFNAVFRCADYDGSIDGLKPLITSSAFPDFLQNMNLILKSDNTQNLRETLRGWIEEGPEGTSRIDRLLPILDRVIKNPSFQDALPVISHLLDAGKTVWADLLPGLGDVVYQDRFPDNIDDAFVLFGAYGSSPAKNPDPNPDSAGTLKKFARFAQLQVDGKTVSLQALELLNDIRNLQLPNTSLYEFVDQGNEKDVLSSIFLESGAARGEEVDPKLNADPDEGTDACDGLNDTIEAREACALHRLFQRPQDGSDAKIVQLAALVSEFEKSHPDFLPALSRWFSANGARVTQGLTDYVVRAQVLANISKLTVDSFLLQYATAHQNWTGTQQVSADDLTGLLKNAFASPDFGTWLVDALVTVNNDALGPKNAQLMKGSTLGGDLSSLYSAPEVSAFGATIIPAGKTITLTQALRRFANLHRTDKLQVNFRGATQSLENHLLDLWVADAKATLGESTVVNFVVQLAQTFFTQMANDFGNNGLTLSEWYFSSPYSNPGTTEAIAGYAVKDLGLMPKYFANLDYLKNDFTNEVFANDDDKRAFRLLVDQVPNIYLYVKSGMNRSGADISRALTLKDRGYLIKNYVALLVKAQDTGWIRRAVRLIETYQQQFPFAQPDTTDVPDDLERQRKVSMAVDAGKRILRSLFEPVQVGDYSTCTMSRFVQPLSAVVSDDRRADTEKFLLTSADQILQTPDSVINKFVADFRGQAGLGALADRRATYQAVSEMLKDQRFPDLVRELGQLFQENAVKPALDFLANKIDDGSLQKVLVFLRRILGFKG
jgi:hypothetical protein